MTKILRSTFPGGFLSPKSCPKCFSLQSQILELHLTSKLKTTLCSLCSWEILASSAFAFQALRRGSRQPNSVSQPFPWKESKACHQKHKERGHSTYKPQNILSLQQTLSWERYIRYMHSKDICVFAWHWLFSLPGTQSTASDRSMSPDGREANAERKVREMRCSKGDNCSLVKAKPFCWGRRESGPYRFWIVCFKVLEILRMERKSCFCPEEIIIHLAKATKIESFANYHLSHKKTNHPTKKTKPNNQLNQLRKNTIAL